MKKDDIGDSLNYESFLKEKFHNKTCTELKVLDEFNIGFFIQMQLGHIVLFSFQALNPLNIALRKHIVFLSPDGTTGILESKLIYLGTVPFNLDGPDYEFIAQMIRNYDNFG